MHVVHDPDAEQYVVFEGEDMLGYAVYDLAGPTMRILHAEVPASKRGKGLGGVVTRAVLDEIRTGSQYRVLALCPYVASFIRKNPEYEDLTTR